MNIVVFSFNFAMNLTGGDDMLNAEVQCTIAKNFKSIILNALG